ncbi:Pentatricopeptide repeat-containing protein [Diplonema papillatum]|nr:Pentatricopeptide repeat-containing protein [Diplonema papillatum]
MYRRTATLTGWLKAGREFGGCSRHYGCFRGTRLIFFDTKQQRNTGAAAEKLQRRLQDMKIARELEGISDAALVKKHDEHAAAQVLAVVRRVLHAGGEDVKQQSYNAAIKIAAKHGDHRYALDLFEEMVSRRIPPMDDSVEHVLRAFTKTKGFAGPALDFLEAAKRRGYSPRRKAWVEIIKLHAINSDMPRARDAATELIARGHKLGADGHHALLLGCASIKEATPIVESMRIDGGELSDTTVQLLLRVCVRNNETAVAERLLEKVKSEGWNVTLRHWTMLMQAYCNACDLKGIASTYHRMLHSGIIVDTYAYLVIVQGLLLCFDSEELKDHHSAMVKLAETATSSGLEGTTIVQAERIRIALLRVYAKLGMYEKAKLLVSRMNAVKGAQVKAELLREALLNQSTNLALAQTAPEFDNFV